MSDMTYEEHLLRTEESRREDYYTMRLALWLACGQQKATFSKAHDDALSIFAQRGRIGPIKLAEKGDD